MNLTVKSSLCAMFLLLCAILNLHAQERYVSQADIDVFIANLDIIMAGADTDDDTVGDESTEDDSKDDERRGMPSLKDIPTATEFVVMLGEFEEPFATMLKEYGMNSEHPIESYYTIMMGTSINFLKSKWLSFLMPRKIKNSIHPDDLSLLKENFDELGVVFDEMF